LDAWNSQGFAGAAAWCSRWVQLEDPPDWPGASVWRGRDAAIARLEEVSAGLGANWAEIGSARSVGDEVVVSMLLKTSGDPGADIVGTFHFVVEIEQDEITRIRVSRTEEEAVAATEVAAGNR
jgi:hypothetical protein